MGHSAGGHRDPSEGISDSHRDGDARPPATLLAEKIAERFLCQEVFVHIIGPTEVEYGFKGNRRGSAEPLFSWDGERVSTFGSVVPSPFTINDVQRARLPRDLAYELANRRVTSLGVFHVAASMGTSVLVELYFSRGFHRWSDNDSENLRRIITSTFSESANTPVVDASQYESPNAERGVHAACHADYERMAQYGNLVILSTDAEFVINHVVGDTESILGVPVDEMLGRPRVWESLIDPRDVIGLMRSIARVRRDRTELSEEVRFVHQRTGEVRWMMLRAIPQFDRGGFFRGWEGFGIDVTERRTAQEDLILQNNRLEAFYEVGRALHGHTDPAQVVCTGLKALVSATGADGGYACFHHPQSGELELVAAFGVSERFLETLQEVLQGRSLLRTVIQTRQGVLVSDLQRDPRANIQAAREGGLRATIMVPLKVSDRVLGALVLFRREAAVFSETDYDVVEAAASQISLAVRQSEMYEAERQHSKALGALYKISHELSKYRTATEIAEHAFPILQREFALNRGWFGVMNDQGTHISGKAGFGPGVRRQLQEVQLELNLRHDFLDEAFRTQRPVVVEAWQQMECSGLNRIIQRLKLDTFVIIPLVSLGQVVGVLLVEPLSAAAFLREGRLQLLVSMANEMATVLMARRFETKMADALKMRMAGLLASGVAHNFNNILQGVLGQVSLIDMLLPKGSPAFESTRSISQAAQRGALLVQQLQNFTTSEKAVRQRISVAKLLEQSEAVYASLLGEKISLVFEIESQLPEVLLDVQSMQQLFSNIVLNARDALATAESGSVRISARKVRVRSAEIDPELAPGLYVRIDVSDNGIGMDAERQARCFEPFYTAKDVDKLSGVGLGGAGLGLSAAYSIAKQHQGSITVHSALGQGATFSVYLPVASPVTTDLVYTSGESVEGQGVQPDGDSLQALLVGLEAGVKPFVTSIFESLGYVVTGAGDLVQAADMLCKNSHVQGFLVLDADAEGPENTERVKQLLTKFAELSVIVIGSSLRGIGAQLSQSPRVLVLEKPLGAWSIQGAVQRLTSGGNGVVPGLSYEPTSVVNDSALAI